MRKHLCLLNLAFLMACSNPPDKKNEPTEIQEINKTIPTEEISEIATSKKGHKIKGERIDGPANVRDTINGRVLLSLNDNVLVETAPEQGKWYLIGITMKLTEQQVKEFKIYPNTDIYSVDDQIIGRTKDTVELWIADEISGLVGAYTHIDNIKNHSIPEKALENEVKKGNLNLTTLKNFLWSFNFQEFRGLTELDYKHFFIYESTVVDPSPRDRISLLFNNKDFLIGVIHSRQMNLNEYETYELIRGHSLTIIVEMNKEEIENIVHKLINFYNSVD